jgi:hypothetical protein
MAKVLFLTQMWLYIPIVVRTRMAQISEPPAIRTHYGAILGTADIQRLRSGRSLV